MALEVPQMKRAILGYRRSTVDQVIAERDDLYHKAVKDKSDLGITLDERTEELERLSAKLADIQAELDAEREHSAELEGRLQTAEASIVESKQENATLEERLLEERRTTHAAEGRVAVAEAEIESLRELGRITTERAVQSGEQALVAEEEVRRLTREIATASEGLETLRARSEIASAEVESHRGRADRFEAEAAQLKRDLERTGSELQQVSSALERARTEVEQLRAVSERSAASTDEGPSATPVGPIDIAAALEMTGDALDRIIGEGRRRLSDEVEVLEHQRAEVATELDELQVRLAGLAMVGSNVGKAVRAARDTIDGAEHAIGAALEPLIGSLAAVDSEMSALEEATNRSDLFAMVEPPPSSDTHDEREPPPVRAHAEEPPISETHDEATTTAEDHAEPPFPPEPSDRPAPQASESGPEDGRHGEGTVHWFSRRDEAR